MEGLLGIVQMFSNAMRRREFPGVLGVRRSELTELFVELLLNLFKPWIQLLNAPKILYLLSLKRVNYMKRSVIER